MILDPKEARKRRLLRVASARDGKVYIGPETVHVHVHVTNRCNLRCGYCWYHSPGNPVHLAPPQDISVKKFAEIVRDCVAMQVDRLYFTAEGEPTCHPDFAAMMALLDKTPLAVTLLTNGTFLPRQEEAVLKADHININLGALDRKAYRLLQGRDLFTRVTGNIARLVRYRDAHKPSLRIKIICVVNELNRGAVREMTRIMNGMGVDAFAPTLMQVTGLSRPLKPAVPLDGDVLSGQAQPCVLCFNGWFAVSIALDGSLSLCCHVTRMKIGSVARMPLCKVWASPAFMRMRLAGKYGHFQERFDECRACRAHERNTQVAKELMIMRGYAKAKAR